MKKKISLLIATLFSVIVIAFVINSCKKSNMETAPSSTLQPSGINSTDPKALPTPSAKELSSSNENELASAKPHFNLDVILRGVNQGEDQGEDRRDGQGEGHSLGHIKFRQDKDAAKIITLDVWVRGLEPNHSYLLQRAVDTNLDGNCTSTAWLTLGKGLTPQSIMTDDRGTGHEDLWRDVSSAATGATFDIHFQIIDEVTSAVVLTSDCYQYTIR